MQLAYLENKSGLAFSDRHGVTACDFHLEGFFKLYSQKSKPLYSLLRNIALLRAAYNGRNNGHTC